MTKKKVPAGGENTQTNTQTTAGKITKAATVIALLSQTEGTTLETMIEATGWQAHSVRGLMSGTLKKKLGKNVISEKTETGRVYRIVDEAAA